MKQSKLYAALSTQWVKRESPGILDVLFPYPCLQKVDANNVTHILGVRAFGTQLLCEQVVGRGLVE